MNKPYLRTLEISELLGLDKETVRGLIRNGILPGRKIGTGRNSAFAAPLSAVLKYQRKMKKMVGV